MPAAATLNPSFDELIGAARGGSKDGVARISCRNRAYWIELWGLKPMFIPPRCWPKDGGESPPDRHASVRESLLLQVGAALGQG